MPELQLGRSSYERSKGDMADLPVINMYVEGSDSEGVVLQSRPALEDRSADMGAGPVEALFRRDGVLNAGLFGVSGGQLYVGTTALGTVTGNELPSIDGNELGVLVCAGQDLHSWDGSTFETITLPDGAAFDAIKVVEGASRFVVIRKGTGRFYFTPALATTFDGLDFATAESQSDQLLDALFVDDALILFGTETVEFWPNTGDNNLPFVPLEQRVLERGIRATGCAAALGSSFAWVTEQNTVCVADENNIISNPGLQERIAASVTCRVFTYFIDGAEFLAIRLDNETQAFDTRSGTWSKLESYGAGNWLPQCHAAGVFGSSIDGRTFAFSDGFEELGGVLERRFRGGLPINGGGVEISNLRLRANPGHTPFLTGPYADAKVEVRLSRDAGQTWGPWIATSLGRQGRYNERIEWRALGMASQPGFLAEFRVTDPVPLRVSGAFVNEPYGGRA